MECLVKTTLDVCLYACLIVLVVGGTLILVILMARFVRDILEDK